MKLQTQCFLPQSTTQQGVDPMIGLRDLRKGLNSILLGYLLSIGSALAAGAVVAYLIIQAGGAPMARKAGEQASTIIFAMVLLLGLAGIGSLTLIVRGKWWCLSNAPEQYHAKWMMFMSILCILAGPLLNTGVFLIGNSEPQGKNRAAKKASIEQLREKIDEFRDGFPELDTRAYVKLAGQGIGMLSGLFFVLFLRAVAKCGGASVRAFFIDMYLLLLAALVFGVVVLIRNPAFLLARPQLLLALLGGWLLSGLWYLGLIVSTSIGITIQLSEGTRPRIPIPAAPPASTLPPLPEMAIQK